MSRSQLRIFYAYGLAGSWGAARVLRSNRGRDRSHEMAAARLACSFDILGCMRLRGPLGPLVVIH